MTLNMIIFHPRQTIKQTFDITYMIIYYLVMVQKYMKSYLGKARHFFYFCLIVANAKV